MNRKVLLMILDGWGEGRHDYSNAIWTKGTPHIDALRAKYPSGHLQAFRTARWATPKWDT